MGVEVVMPRLVAMVGNFYVLIYIVGKGRSYDLVHNYTSKVRRDFKRKSGTKWK